MMVASNRIKWVDCCKGLAISLVILGHTLRTDVSLVYIYGFHMPLFFFLSGLVFNEKKYTWSSFLKSRFNTLVLPYVFFYLLTYLYWYFVEKSFRPIDLSWYQPLIGMVYGAQWHGLMDHNGILWFLPCLFVTELIFFAVKRISKVGWQLLIVAILAIIGITIKQNLPWCANIAAVSLVFLYLGNYSKPFFERDSSKKSRCLWLTVALALCVCYYIMASYWKNEVQMAAGNYGNIIAFWILSIVGVSGIVLMCKSLTYKKTGLLGYLGRNTLVIFALHQPVLRIVRFLGGKLFSFFPVETSIVYAMAADVVVIMLLLPLIWLWNKYGLKGLKHLYIK